MKLTPDDVWCVYCGPNSYDQETVDQLAFGGCDITNTPTGALILNHHGVVIHDCRGRQTDGQVEP